MSQVQKYILKTALKYGLTGGVLIILFYSGLLLSDKNIFFPALIYLAGLMVAVIILFAIFEYNQVDIVPRFWKNMTVGMLCNLVITAIFSLLMLIILIVVKPEFHKTYLEERVAMMLEYQDTYIEKFGKEHFELLLADVQGTSVLDLVFDGPLKISFSSLFFTILLSLIFYLIKSKNLNSK